MGGIEGAIMTKQCCKCGRVEHDGVWESQRVKPVDRWSVTHGYCPECFSVALAEIEVFLVGKELMAPEGRRPTGTKTQRRPCA